MKKKILLFVGLLALLVCLFALTASAATPNLYIEFKVMLEGSSDYIPAYVANYDSGSPRLNMAEPFYYDVDFTTTIDKNKITKLDFSDAVAVKSQNPLVTAIYSGDLKPFVSCNEVRWPTAPGSATTIGACTFQNWTSLKTFEFGTATVFVDRCFNGCAFESLTLPATVQTIMGGAFSGNKSLTTLKFEGDIPNLSASAFSGCTALTNVDLGPMTKVGAGMFSSCTSLESITIPSTVKTIEKEAFAFCTALESITIPEGVTTIGEMAFYRAGLKEVTIAASVTTIAKQAFHSNTDLSVVTFAQGTQLTTIGNEAFCKIGKASIVIPSTVTSMGSSVFLESGIVSVVFEEGCATTLGSSIFMSTKSLQTVVLSEGIPEIPYQCFYGSVLPSIVIPNSVKSIANRAFSENKKLSAIVISEESQLETMGSAFNGTSITEIYLPTGVKITDSPFSQCHSLEYIYNLENAVVETSAGLNVIPNSFFYECRAIREIKIPNGVTSIGKSVFNRCGGENCVAIYFPASVVSIDKETFPKSTDWLAPKDAVIFYAGGDASKLLSLTADGDGNISVFLKEKIDNGMVVDYAGLDAEYEKGVIVNNASTCDVYSDGTHIEDSNPCVIFCTRCGLVKQDPNAVHSFDNGVCTYENGFNCGGTLITTCQNYGCMYNVSPIVEATPALFTCLGYSVSEYGNGGITVGYTVNNEAIAVYTAKALTTLSYGIFAVSKSKLGNGDVFDENGQAISGAFVAEISKEFSTFFEMKVCGFTEGNSAVELALGAYVQLTRGEDIEYFYMQASESGVGESYSFVTYNGLINN